MLVIELNQSIVSEKGRVEVEVEACSSHPAALGLNLDTRDFLTNEVYVECGDPRMLLS